MIFPWSEIKGRRACSVGGCGEGQVEVGRGVSVHRSSLSNASLVARGIFKNKLKRREQTERRQASDTRIHPCDAGGNTTRDWHVGANT